MRTLRFRSPREDGAAAVEFALLLPILVALLFGTVEFARAYNTLATLNHAAREGARTLAVTKDQSAAESAARDAATSLDKSKLTISAPACSPSQAATVTASYPLQLHIPLVLSKTYALTGQGVMRCGG